MHDTLPSFALDCASGTEGSERVDRSESTSQSDRPVDREMSIPNWVPGDDTIARNPDRQVLVVGETVVGLALAHFLRHAGYDPLLVAGTEQSSPSRVTYLWPPVLRALDAVGVGTAVLDCAAVVDSVSVRRPDSDRDRATVLRGDAASTTAPPVVVRTRDLRQVLAGSLPEDGHRGERTVDALSRRDGGLRVAFANGVTEWFDAAVDATTGDASLGPGDEELPESTRLWQYETTVDAAATDGCRLRERWYPDALVQRLPRPNRSGRLLRVTAAGSDLPAPLADDTDGESPSDGGALASELAGVQPVRVRQVGLSDPEARRACWASGRVAFCGSAAYPFAPASGAAVSLGVEDALAFVRRLVGEPRPVAEVLDDYAVGRARRIATLGRTARTARSDHDYPVYASVAPPFDALATVRAVALGPFLGSSCADLQHEGFAR
jgi:2-polyprenyl-6-methoxyphenol hydroxylase-like FAD-dependent oxidoreductase